MSKLVRDKIPEIIRSHGDEAKTRIADNKEYWERLKTKLKEEVDEYVESEDEEELADIYEVLHAIYDFKKIDKQKLSDIRKKKADERGKFEKKIILE
jgi:predicted house-cleaning noncanonical NTP pyrophosphatase (MazG superfamily)